MTESLATRPGGPAGTGERPGITGLPGGVAVATALPRDLDAFTGRAQELDRLAAEAGTAGGVAAIYAIGGRAGTGTTALAVHAAHQLARRFADGLFFVALRGHAAGQRPVDPAEALAGLLLAAGVDARQIPAGQADRALLWRDRLAGRRVLLLLDDAASGEQVGPLLPGGAGLVLVTSRDRLRALDETATVSLDVLPAGQAAELLVRRAGRPGLRPGDPAVAEIAGLCGYLPLALELLAGRLAHRPGRRPSELAADLAAACAEAELADEDDWAAAAAFRLTYAELAPDLQRLLRRLGLYPGAEIDAWAAAALDDGVPGPARQLLDDLCDQRLMTEPAAGRYRFHDVIRGYARACAAADDPIETDAAISRLLGSLEGTAATADALVARYPRPDAAARYLPPAGAPVLESREQALTWLRGQRADLLACVGYAAGRGLRARVVALAAGLSALLRTDGPWAEALELSTVAAAAAGALGDRAGEAAARSDAAAMLDRAGDHAGAVAELTRAAALARDIGRPLAEAAVLSELGAARSADGDFPGAVASLEQALELYVSGGSRQGVAAALVELAHVRSGRGQPGDLAAARWALARALDLYRDLGDQHGEASASGRLGALLVMAGEVTDAAAALQRAQALYRELGSRAGEAVTLSGLAVLRRLTGDDQGAVRALERAGDLYRDLGHRAAEAETLNRLGTLRLQAGDHRAALDLHRHAQEVAAAAGSEREESRALEGAARAARPTRPGSA
jgi:tetratricopeptide (TPR) repeat protein